MPTRPAAEPPTSLPGVLHPVGKLPAAVYWRRRAVLLVLVLGLLGAGAWFGIPLLADEGTQSSASTATASRPVPALERVVPSFEAVVTPTPALVPSSADTAAVAAPAPPAPVAGSPCTDDMISLQVGTAGSVSAASKPTFELRVANISAVPCVRALDKGLQELVLYDLSGNRIWGSNDCFPEASSDPRTIAPGEVVTVPIVWGGLTSEPTCTAPRVHPGPGNYLLRARLDTKVSPDAPVTLT